MESVERWDWVSGGVTASFLLHFKFRVEHITIHVIIPYHGDTCIGLICKNRNTSKHTRDDRVNQLVGELVLAKSKI